MKHSIASPNASRSTAPPYVRARTGFWQMGTSMLSRVIRLTVNRISTGSQNGGIRGISRARGWFQQGGASLRRE